MVAAFSSFTMATQRRRRLFDHLYSKFLLHEANVASPSNDVPTPRVMTGHSFDELIVRIFWLVPSRND